MQGRDKYQSLIVRRITNAFIFLLSAQWSCREKYEPNVESSGTSYLVVEANMCPGGGQSTAYLTRTFSLDDSAKVITENNAQVMVVGKDNTEQPLTNKGNGHYEDSGLNVIANNEYRLHIVAGGKEYWSDYVMARMAPPIDTIGWKRDDGGVEINVSTHDPSNQSKRYKWEYEETWETHAKYFSYFFFENGVLSPRNLPEDDVFTCWKYNNSSEIILENSSLLSADTINQRPIIYVLNGDDRFTVRYTVLVKQYALDEGAYNFLELMKKNTEEIGSLFSAQPSELRGNISCLNNPSEYVLGYVTASSVSQKRIFLYPSDFPSWGYDVQCSQFATINNPDTLIKYFFNYGVVPYEAVPFSPVLKLSERRCTDCVYNKGTKKRPPFW